MKTSNTLKSITVVMFAALQVFSCKDEDKSPPTDLGFFSLSEAKDYLYFKPGGYWVYKYPSGLLDTQVLITMNLDTVYAESKRRKFHYETLSYQVKSKTTNDDYWHYDWFPPNADAVDFHWSYEVFREVVYNNNMWGGGINNTFTYPFDTSRQSSGTLQAAFVEKLSSFIINSHSYDEVVKFHVKQLSIWPDVFNNNGPADIYWAKDIGMIRIHYLPTNQTIDLVEHSVEKP